MREYMRVEPVNFGVEHKPLLYHAKFMLENKYVQIHPTLDKLILALRSAWVKDGVLDKVTSHDDTHTYLYNLICINKSFIYLMEG
jgi:hypothetical protein